MLLLSKISKNSCLNLLIAMSLLAAATNTLAQPVAYCSGCLWHPFMTLGAGIAMTSNGSSQTFVDPVTGLDIYSTNDGIHNIGALDSFFGMKWSFHPRWELQLGLGYNQTTSITIKGSWVQSASTPSAQSFTYQYNIIPRQYLAESKLLFNLGGGYHPYLVAGVGISQNTAYSYTSSSSSSIFDRQTTSSFSYNGGAGLDIDVIRNLRLGLGYRFINFGKVQLGNQIVASVPVGGSLFLSNLYVHEGLVELTYIFY